MVRVRHRHIDPGLWPVALDPARGLEGRMLTPSLAIWAYDDVEKVAIGGFVIPAHFFLFADWMSKERPRTITELEVNDGQLRIRALTVWPREGERLTTSNLRSLSPQVILQTAGLRAGGRDEGGLIAGFEHLSDGEYAALKGDIAAAATDPPRRGKRLPDEHLQRVATVYREGEARGYHPTKYVASRLNTARSNAGRWVMEARRRGFLGAAEPGRAGEVKKPAKKRRTEGGTNG
jgi:hypothetical protein